MNKQSIYHQLAESMVKYADLATIPSKESGEKLLLIPTSRYLFCRQINPTNMQIYDKPIFVRKSVAQKLVEASLNLSKVSADYALEVVYGYRDLSVQKKLFEKFRLKLGSKFDGIELLEAIHRNIAVPDVAGHPAGAAVDVRILDNGHPLDMGTDIWEFTPDSYTFSPFVGDNARNNRVLLRDVMKQVGFAPYDGEWWHFSYGDKDWAYYYDKSFAIYGLIEQKDIDLAEAA